MINNTRSNTVTVVQGLRRRRQRLGHDPVARWPGSRSPRHMVITLMTIIMIMIMSIRNNNDKYPFIIIVITLAILLMVIILMNQWPDGPGLGAPAT